MNALRTSAGAFALRALALVLLPSACGGDSHEPGPPTVDAGRTAPDKPIAARDAGPDIFHVPPGATPSRGGDAGPAQHNANGFGVMLPTGPRSSARIRGQVMTEGLQPLSNAGASAGGAVVAIAENGFFLLDEVYGDGDADVVVRAPGFTEGRVRVPIRDDQVSYVTVVLTALRRIAIADLASATSLELPKNVVEDAEPPLPDATLGPLTLALPANGLVTAWGAIGKGPGSMSAVAFDRRAQMAALPGGGMLGLQADGTRVRLRGRAVFELHVDQGGTHFELKQPASVTVPLWSDEMATPWVADDDDTAAADQDHLYWFDPAQALFVERGAINDDTASFAHGEIDRFGLWTVARPARGLDCARGKVVDEDAAPVAFAAVHATEVVRFDGVSLFADEGGEFCTDTPAHGTLDVIALGGSAAHGVVRVKDARLNAVARAPGVDTPAMCTGDDGACVDLGAFTASLNQRCVSGTVESPGGPVTWLADGSDSASGKIAANEPFCLEAPIGALLRFTSDHGDCSMSSELTVSPGQGLCGESECQDVGTLHCCSPTEACDDDYDGDCDGMVDEGCSCGGVACSQSSQQICCTSADACGSRSTISGKCFAEGQPGRAEPSCPNEVGDDQLSISGCCREDGRCGLQHQTFGCVAREEAGDVFVLTASLAPLSCAF